jgi:hypothetical protein
MALSGKACPAPKGVLGLCAGVLALLGPAQVHAGPSTGTDANVVGTAILEMEIAPILFVRGADGRLVAAPSVAAVFGLGGDVEVGIGGRLRRQRGGEADGTRIGVGDVTLSIKHAMRHGSLAPGGSGPGLAAECGLLLPGIRAADGNGAFCSGIVSQRFEHATLHLNVSMSHTRDDRRGRFVGLIVELPRMGAVRPVLEAFSERESGLPCVRSRMAGLIWTRSDGLAIDAGLRRAWTGSGQLTEFRVGMTWSLESAQR